MLNNFKTFLSVQTNQIVTKNCIVSYHIKQPGETYPWNGSLTDLKCFVKEILNLEDKLISPGGDVKLFNAADSGFLIKKM